MKNFKLIGFLFAITFLSFININNNTVYSFSPSTVDTSTSNLATAESFQNKIFFDELNNRHWSFYYSGSGIKYSYSDNGTDWTVSNTLNYNTSDFSIQYKTISGTSYVFLTTNCNTYDVCVLKGTLSVNGITWSDPTTIADGNSTSNAYSKPVISVNSANKIFVIFRHVSGGHQMNVRISTGPSNIDTWDSIQTVGDRETSLDNYSVISTPNNSTYIIIGNDSNNIVSYSYDVNTDAWFKSNDGGDSSWFSFRNTILNGAVFATAVSGSDLYIGGSFSQIGDITVNRIAKWNGSSWSALGTGVNGTVRAIAVSGSDVHIGGEFTQAGGSSANRIAKWNGSSWSALGSGINNNYVRAIAISGANVYAAGDFTQAGGSPANRLAKWDGSSWSTLGSGVNSTVHSIAISGSNVYVGGGFTQAGGSPASKIAKWNGTSWSALGSGANNTVHSIAISGSDVYVGGSFTQAGGSSANRIAKWNGTSWSALGSGVNVGWAVYSIAISGANVYAAGDFTQAGGSPANRAARWDGSSWSALGVGTNSDINAMVVSGSDVYVGGAFDQAGGESAVYIAQWDGSDWSALASGVNKSVNVITTAGSDIYVGGLFTQVGDISANRVAKWDGSNWSALGGGVNGRVRAIAVSGSTVYAGGDFTQAGGSPANYIARWNGSSWSALGSGVNGAVNAIAISGSNIYVGGDFTQAGGSPANYIARWNGSSWSALGVGVNGKVYAVTVSGANAYVGGLFTQAGGSPANRIAKWDGSSWSVLGSGSNGPVYAVAVSGQSVYVGGYFTNVGGVNMECFAKWNGSSWSALGVPCEFNQAYNPGIHTIAVSGSDIYVGGRTGVFHGNIKKWNGSSWSMLGGGVNNFVNAIAVLGSDVYVGGDFVFAAGGSSSNISRYFSYYSQVLVSSLSSDQQVSVTTDNSNNVHLVYRSRESGNNGYIRYKKWNGTTWASSVTIDSGSSNSNPSVAFNSENNNIYAFYKKSNDIYYATSSSPYTSWSSPQLVDTNSNYPVVSASNDRLAVAYTKNNSGNYSINHINLTESSSGSSHSISGKVKYFNQSKAIPSVNVILRNSSNVQVATTLTDTSGNYQFTNIPGGVSYTLRVATTSVMTGVNNADQTIVRKYILGRPIVAPVLTNYAFIKVAGDVNSNGALNQNDQNSIRSLVLRQILSDGTTIPANALWKFFDSSATVTPSNYLQPALNIRTLTNLSTNLTGQDFIGVMTGDASGNW
jgi:hypothetical protein